MNQFSASFLTKRMDAPLVTLSFLDPRLLVTDYCVTAAGTTNEQFCRFDDFLSLSQESVNL